MGSRRRRCDGVSGNGSYATGDIVYIAVNFDRDVSVAGMPLLELQSGGSDRYATYASGDGTSTLTFAYTVLADDFTFHLDYDNAGAIDLNGGSIQNCYGVNANLGLAAPGDAGSLGAESDIGLTIVFIGTRQRWQMARRFGTRTRRTRIGTWAVRRGRSPRG